MGSKGSKAKKQEKKDTGSKSQAAAPVKDAAAPPPAKKENEEKKKGSAVERVQKELEKTTASKEDAPKAAPANSKAKFARNQWVIEKVKADDGEVAVTVEKTMHACAIYQCEGAVIKISGKSASVQIEGCKKTSVFVEDVVGTVQISNCKSVKVYVSGVAPSISIDKTDGILLDLSESCVDLADFMITAANSSEMNASFEHNGEKVELPIPEQFVHKLNMGSGKGKIESNVSSLYSA